jgi:hypothetical protein
MRRIVLTLVVALLIVGATAAPAFAARPDCAATNWDCGVSPEHRANPSGKGNFGQCARGFNRGGGFAKEFNPSPQNTGECDLRFVTTRDFAIWTALSIVYRCEPPLEAVAESQITFRPSLDASGYAACT